MTSIRRPRPTPTPRSIAARAPLLVDSAARRLYARAVDRRTLVFDTHSGRQIGGLPAEGPMALDAARNRLFVDRLWYGRDGLGPAVLAFDTQTLSQTMAVPLPLPESSTMEEIEARYGGAGPIAPQLDSITGRLYAFRGASVFEIDPAVAQVVRRIDGVLADHPGELRQALLLPDGRTLIATKFDLTREAYDYNLVLAAFDLRSGRERYRQSIHGHHELLGVVGDRVLATGEWGRGGESNLYQWSADGISVTSEGWPMSIVGAAHDTRRGRLIVSIARWSAPSIVAVVDPDTLDLLMVVETPVPGIVSGYDAAGDVLYFEDEGVILVVGAGALVQPRASPEPFVASADRSISRIVVSPDWPRDTLLMANARIRSKPGRCPQQGIDAYVVASEDGGNRWLPRPIGIEGCDGASLTLSPGFATDRTVFASKDKLGLFRSEDAGRTWRTASVGLKSMSITGVQLSPGFVQDRTVFAESRPYEFLREPGVADLSRSPQTAWRSRDGGRNWEPIGSFFSLALSPHFARDQTIYAFGNESFGVYRSSDAGERWVQVGRLPERPTAEDAPGRDYSGQDWVPSSLYAIEADGDGPPILFARLMLAPQPLGFSMDVDLSGATYRSADGGQTWRAVQAVLPWAEGRAEALAADGMRALIWAFSVWDEPARRNVLSFQRSDDLGQTWYDVAAPPGSDPGSLYELADGRILIRGDGNVLTVHSVEEFAAMGGDAGDMTSSLAPTRRAK